MNKSPYIHNCVLFTVAWRALDAMRCRAHLNEAFRDHNNESELSHRPAEHLSHTWWTNCKETSSSTTNCRWESLSVSLVHLFLASSPVQEYILCGCFGHPTAFALPGICRTCSYIDLRWFCKKQALSLTLPTHDLFHGIVGATHLGAPQRASPACT